MQNWRTLKSEDVGLGRAVFRGNVEMLPTSDMMRFVCSGGIWTQGSAVHMVFTCLDCLFVHSKPGLLYNFCIQCNCACCKENSKNLNTLLSIVLQLCS